MRKSWSEGRGKKKKKSNHKKIPATQFQRGWEGTEFPNCLSADWHKKKVTMKAGAEESFTFAKCKSLRISSTMMPGVARDGLISRRPRGRQGKAETPSPGRTASSPSLPPTFVKRRLYHCGKSHFPGKRRKVCLQPLPDTSSHRGCGQPGRGPRFSQVDPSRPPVRLSQCPLRFRVPPLVEGMLPCSRRAGHARATL